MSKTRLFNIRITEEKHAKFKKYAEEQGVTMAYLLTSYMDALMNEEVDPIGTEPNKKRQVWEDPLDGIRGQYRKGEDF